MLAIKSTIQHPFSRGNEDLPSILEQTKWEVGFYEFPNQTKMVEYFNCGFATWKEREWLVCRRRKINGHKARNEIVLWHLKDNVPTTEIPIRIIEKFYGEHQEDPRALVHDGDLYIGYCNFRKISYAHQCFGKVNENATITNPLHVSYGQNGPNLMSNKGYEKNWIWFFHDGELYFIYMTFPHIVCKTKGVRVVQEYETEKFNWLWNCGEPRGGTTPIRVGNLYYSFFHSSLPNEKFRRRYYMGAYCFRAEPPFEIVAMTGEPLLGASEHDPRNEGAPLCVFPNGSKFDGKNWMVTMGVNDFKCGFLKIPHDDLVRNMERTE